MIQCCLKNRIRERPTIREVVQFLEQARAEIDDGEYDVSKLVLVQTLSQRMQLIERREEENQSLNQQLTGKNRENQLLQEALDSQMEQNRTQQGQIRSLQAEIALLKQPVEV